MKIQNQSTQRRQRGYALALTLIFISISLAMLASLARWTASSTIVTARNNAYNGSVCAAEAATEVVISQMNRDFLHQSSLADLDPYTKTVPAKFAPTGWTTDYQFSDGQGHANKASVTAGSWVTSTNVDPKYPGLYGMVNTFAVTSAAKCVSGPYPVAAEVQQTFTLATIPIFQFAVFYNMDLEINPSPAMIIGGKVHANGDIYTAPQTSLDFMDTVSATGHIYNQRNPNDPTVTTPVAPVYHGAKLETVSSLTLPIGVDNTPSNVVQILDVPPGTGEDPYSEMGRQRYYNKSDLIITTTDTKLTVEFNDYERGTHLVTLTNDLATGTGFAFLKTNVTFYDYREGTSLLGIITGKPVLCTEIDVAAFTNWLASGQGAYFNQTCHDQNGHYIYSVYVNDQRTPAGKLAAVRVANGRYLPSDGLTLATPRPLYVLGHFNAPDLGSADTSKTKPASLIADAVTILSAGWSDTYSATTTTDAGRVASATTVNAAIISGIVPSVTAFGKSHYSGGAENLMRFLEHWGSSTTYTYNGSLVVMFESRYATGYWAGTGSYYTPPKRDWAFDANFLNPAKLPPAYPSVKKLQRGQWSVIAVNNNAVTASVAH